MGMTIRSDRDNRYHCLALVIRKFHHAINPQEVIDELEREREDPAHYIHIIRTILLDDLESLLRIMCRINPLPNIERPKAVRANKRVMERDLVQWRNYVCKTLHAVLSLGKRDPHVRLVLANLTWEKHGKIIYRVFPDLREYQRLRERHHYPLPDPDPFIIGCHGRKCRGKGGITRQAMSLILKEDKKDELVQEPNELVRPD